MCGGFEFLNISGETHHCFLLSLSSIWVYFDYREDAILTCGLKQDAPEEDFVVLTMQPRPAVAQIALPEIPSGNIGALVRHVSSLSLSLTHSLLVCLFDTAIDYLFDYFYCFGCAVNWKG